MKGELIKMKNRNKYYNPNPKKIETGDCVVRAICKATGKDWDTVYQELVEIGFELKVMPNSDTAWKHYLSQHGFIEHKISNKKGTKRPTVASFARTHPKGTFILRIANHIVTCVDGYYFDIWDCGDSSLYGFWERPSKESAKDL